MAKRATRSTSRLNIISDKNNRKIRLHCGNWLRYIGCTPTEI
nr:MAG TPA: peptidase [Caudoviricetes sp.]